MTDDAKEWVTVKIEEPVRDDASDYNETYTNIMRAGLKALYADMVAVRSDGAVELRQADEPIEDTPATNGVELGDLREQLDRIEEAQGGTVNRSLELVENDMEAALEKLDRIESAASTAEERTGSIENTLDNMGGR